MGSWAELDAIYPPGKLTPATALIVALGHQAGATSVYAAGNLASFVPSGIGIDAELLGRAEHYLGGVAFEQFIEEAAAMLSRHQKHAVAQHLIERQASVGVSAVSRSRVAQIIAGFGVDSDLTNTELLVPASGYDLSIFPQ